MLNWTCIRIQHKQRNNTPDFQPFLHSVRKCWNFWDNQWFIGESIWSWRHPQAMTLSCRSTVERCNRWEQINLLKSGTYRFLWTSDEPHIPSCFYAIPLLFGAEDVVFSLKMFWHRSFQLLYIVQIDIQALQIAHVSNALSQVKCHVCWWCFLWHTHTHTYKMLPFIDFHWCHVWLRITNGILHVINAWYSVIFTLTVCVYICTFRWLLDSLTLPLYPLNSQGDGDWFQCLAMWWFRCPRTVGVTQFTCDMHGCVVVFAMSQRFYCSSLFLHFKWFKCLLMLRSAKQTPILYLEKQVHIQSAWIKMLHLRQQHDSLQLAIIRYPARNESGRCWDVNSSTFDTG